MSGKRPVDVARALVVSTDGRFPNRLPNSRNELIKLAKGRTIAVMESLPDELLHETICAVGDKPEVTDEKKKQLWQMVLETENKLTDEEIQQDVPCPGGVCRPICRAAR